MVFPFRVGNMGSRQAASWPDMSLIDNRESPPGGYYFSIQYMNNNEAAAVLKTGS
ncbi:hypothetical protein SXCC_01623 [Gluconacetobacter sp. SXCC-1]|nr:hypothetical protein SXCC_01623 [Gluconacetobacter sp. SXCC-1]